MRRADRLFRLVQLLRRSRLTTAAKLAEALEVSERTVYRDVRDLSLSGVPIRGEAGVGYALEKGFDLPPLTFNEEELEALVLGARVVESHGDKSLGAAASAVLAKVEAALPDRLKARMREVALLAPGMRVTPPVDLELVRGAIRSRHKLVVRYRDAGGRATNRVLWPLVLAFWGRTWTLGAWCELRRGFRSFRMDAIESCSLSANFPERTDRNRDSFLAHVRANPTRLNRG